MRASLEHSCYPEQNCPWSLLHSELVHYRNAQTSLQYVILHQVNQEGGPSSPVRLGLSSKMTKNSPSAKWVIAGNLRFAGYSMTAKEALHLLKRLRYYPDPMAALDSAFPLSLFLLNRISCILLPKTMSASSLKAASLRQTFLLSAHATSQKLTPSSS